MRNPIPSACNVSPDFTGFVRREAVKFAAFCVGSVAAVVLSGYSGRGQSLSDPRKLALAAALVFVGSLAVVLAERSLDAYIQLREEDTQTAYALLGVGVGTLMVGMVVFYVSA